MINAVTMSAAAPARGRFWRDTHSKAHVFFQCFHDRGSLLTLLLHTFFLGAAFLFLGTAALLPSSSTAAESGAPISGSWKSAAGGVAVAAASSSPAADSLGNTARCCCCCRSPLESKRGVLQALLLPPTSAVRELAGVVESSESCLPLLLLLQFSGVAKPSHCREHVDSSSRVLQTVVTTAEGHAAAGERLWFMVSVGACGPCLRLGVSGTRLRAAGLPPPVAGCC